MTMGECCTKNNTVSLEIRNLPSSTTTTTTTTKKQDYKNNHRPWGNHSWVQKNYGLNQHKGEPVCRAVSFCSALSDAYLCWACDQFFKFVI
ncbi:hypothetical protein P5673_002131 [Acropora cervicornis]|uniref:Uncharacterized protein n=1 Tax=Acropora cervicornis TaxID=6130 RepID=A0AAD9R5E8_ACRCE|nr:hypothetical protein P5673_002131 [Acropora cervicornis]